MALTHVCVWDPKIGYRRISIDEACTLYPYGVSARSGHFVCELCAQNVLLTAPGANVQHFRHDPSAPNKECDERQSSFDNNYGRSFLGLSSHIMPLRIQVYGSRFTLQLGFFLPPDSRARCEKIKIVTDTHQVFEYSFERIERAKTTYLNVGHFPSQIYDVEYINADLQLRNYWPTKISGTDLVGSFFDARTGQILPPGGKAYSGNDYYLLGHSPVYSSSRDIESVEISRISDPHYITWYLYRIRIKKFSRSSAQFFLKHAIFLTEHPTKFYPIWPSYVKSPYCIFHNATTFYYYLCGDDAELHAYPTITNSLSTEGGRLYKLFSREKTQLVSLGKAGALGFSYLIKSPLDKQANVPLVKVVDQEGTELSEDIYTKLPKSKTISVSSQFDGKAVVLRKGKIEYISRLAADEITVFSNISFATKIQFYQGCDCIRSLQFEPADIGRNIPDRDYALVQKLQMCAGPIISAPHSVGALVNKYKKYPRTKQWLLKSLRKGEIPRNALLILNSTIP